MKRLLLLAALFSGPAFAQAYLPPPPPGYSYVIPYSGIPTFASVVTSVLTAAGDLACISGSDSRNVRVTKVGISATANQSNVVTASLIKRSSANAGGNPVMSVPYDSSIGQATAAVMDYDTVTTPGIAVGTVRSAKLPVGTTGNLATVGLALFVFEPAPLLLRGPSEFLCANVSAIGIGASALVEFEHQETRLTQGY